MDGRPTMKDQLYLDKLERLIEKMCDAADLIAHRLKEINGTLGRIDFWISQGENNDKDNQVSNEKEEPQ